MFCLPSSGHGHGPVLDITEDQDQHQHQEEQSNQQSSPESGDFYPEKTKDLEKTNEKDSAAEIPILNDEITAGVMTEHVETLCQNPATEDRDQSGEKPFVWTVSERESCFYLSDSDE